MLSKSPKIKIIIKMSSTLNFLTIISLLISSIISSNKTEARIKFTAQQNWEIVYQDFDPNENYVATAFYTDSLLEVGWDKLSISTNDIYKDEIQAEGAGRLEGALTKDRIYDFYLNLKEEIKITEQISKFLEDQENFVINSVENGEGKRDPILYNAYLIKKQYNGMIEEYNIHADADKKLEKNNFHLMNYYLDLMDLSEKFKVETEGEKDYKKMDNKELFKIFLERNHCSALFKLKNDFSDLYFGHNTWNTYFSAIRLIKEYNFNFNNRWIRSKNIIFTSYPATLYSIDDFYISSHGLISIETTNSFFNDSLYSKMTPNSIFTCERAMICNRISNSSKEWAENFAKYNSGTYNNQFMILDKNKVDLVNKSIEIDAFYIVETLPGLVKINNVSDIFKFGYWSSFNVPYDKEIYDLSGLKEVIDANPWSVSYLSYDMSARTKIFRRDQWSSDNLEGFMKLMRYNDYKHDPFSENNPGLSISSRADLDSGCHGAYDSKVGVLSEWGESKIKFHLIGGPTYGYDGVEPFAWNNAKDETCRNHVHYSIPEVLKFDWIEYENEFSFEK